MGWVIWIPLVGIFFASAAYHLGILDTPPADAGVSPASQSANVATPAQSAEYAALISMVTYESQNYWNISNAFLLAETILAAVAVALVEPSDGESGSIVHWLVPAVGVLVGLLWIAAVQRSRAYTTLRVLQARALEQALGYTVFTAGESLSKHRSVRVNNEVVSMGLLGGRISIRGGGLLLAVIFTALFAYLFQVAWDATLQIR